MTLTLTLDPELEAEVARHAKRRGIPPEELALEVLRNRLIGAPGLAPPKNDWERLLASAGSDCGGVFSDKPLGSEEIYDE